MPQTTRLLKKLCGVYLPHSGAVYLIFRCLVFLAHQVSFRGVINTGGPVWGSAQCQQLAALPPFSLLDEEAPIHLKELFSVLRIATETVSSHQSQYLRTVDKPGEGEGQGHTLAPTTPYKHKMMLSGDKGGEALGGEGIKIEDTRMSPKHCKEEQWKAVALQ